MLLVHPKSALKKYGWFKSFHLKKVINKNGDAIPWWTYSFIDFISDRLNSEMRVLEFGCGGSTIYLSSRVKEVVSIEDYQEWAEKTSKLIGSGSKIIVVSAIEKYFEYQNMIEGNFDILVIDNLGDRMKCVGLNLKYLNDSGVVIWDNTDGTDWCIIKNYMASYGFKDLSFSGMTAQELASSRTTLFYKEKNCLNI